MDKNGTISHDGFPWDDGGIFTYMNGLFLW